MLLTFFMLIIFFSTNMLMILNPLAMGLTILIQTMLICVSWGLLTKTYWFSYILFLTFLGGMMVMFIYTTSIASNEIFKFKIFNIFFKMIIFTIITIIFMYFYNKYLMTMINSMEMNMNMNNFLLFNNENKLNLIKLYNNQNYLMTMIIMTYLLITLIAVIKIINNIFGSLRML